MKAFVTAIVIATVFGVGAYLTLSPLQRPVETAFVTQGVRL